MICQQEKDEILEEEGFRSKPYKDSLGIDTFGHGLTYITEEESAFIVEHFRLPEIERQLKARLPWLEHSHPEVQRVLIHMAYQLGVSGVCKFKDALHYMREQDYERAADEMLDSRWAKQTAARANRLADRVRSLA